MALYVYVTEHCRERARVHTLLSELESFKERVEATQSISLLDPFPYPYLVKKKLGGRQGRLVADFRQMGEHAVIVFLTIMIRGERAYETDFSRNPLQYGKQHFSNLVSTPQLERFLDERTRIQPAPPKPEPSAEEYDFLYDAFAHRQGSKAEELVCESRLWVEKVSQDRIAKQLALFVTPCLDALSLPGGLHFVPIPSRPTWGIWAFRTESRLFLITPVSDDTSQESERQARALAGRLQDQDPTGILRESRRAYPALVLADDELWIDLERDPHANMALSPEESDVLESARHNAEPFPLFINGRAGSGKSTILQYLFADLLFHYLRHPEGRPQAPPIYLTANGELLRVARAFVERMLRSEARFVEENGQTLVDENRDLLHESFREFQPHLLSLVPPDVRSTRFSRASRVDYTRFRQMWSDRFAREKRAYADFGPDLSWHIIRSYIKGMSSETYLEPEDYAQLPENQVTVTQDAFRLVHDRVWIGWYQSELEEKGLWDDQDLARYVLDHDLVQRIYPAVFCDEAQDFTRIELELLLRLSLFSDRQLAPQDISRVPFAFAGDHFQTLNPTGFRWDAIKASFVEKFIYELDPARRTGRTDLSFRELQYNYRSTHKIVRFCNSIQALRAALFQLPDVRPQVPWTSEPRPFPVVWFHANDGLFWQRFKQHGNFVVIVPCNEGEERAFVENDPVLREHIQIEDGVPVNVLSAGKAKGREYPAVLVYGFGANAQGDVLSQLTHGDTAPSNPDRSLPLQYFVNRLYVAVSRPQQRLVIVDTEEGLRRLWDATRDEAAEQKVLARIRNGREIWAGEIEGMTVGDPDDLTRERATDLLENARAFEAEGRSRHDPFLLKQAALAYKNCGQGAKARECRARALEAEGEMLEAGEEFFSAGFALPEGVRCLWRSLPQGWKLLSQRAAQYPQIKGELEYQWAAAVVQSAGPEEISRLLTLFAHRLEDSAYADTRVGDLLWRDALDLLLDPLFDKKGQPLSPAALLQLLPSLAKIKERGIKVPPRPCAQIFFLGRRYRDAIALWEESGDTKLREYALAKASVEPYPQRVLHLKRLESLDRRRSYLDEIISSYDASPGSPLSTEEATVVSDALCEKKRLTEAYALAWGADCLSMLLVALTAYRKGDSLAKIALQAGIMLLVKQGRWEILGQLASTTELVPTPEWRAEEIRSWVRQESKTLEPLLIRCLARSDLHLAPSHLQRPLSDFLRRHLLSGTRCRDLSLMEAGAALERAGRFTDAIAFYEGLIETHKKDRQWVERWAICKHRQLEHERSRGNTSRVAALLKEIEAGPIKNVQDLPRFPPLEDLPKPSLIQPPPPPEEPQSTQELDRVLTDPVPMQFGAFKLLLSRNKGRCNIENTDSMETAFLKFRERICGAAEVEFSQDDTGRWTCKQWALSVEFSEEEGPICLSFHGLGVHVQLQP